QQEEEDREPGHPVGDPGPHPLPAPVEGAGRLLWHWNLRSNDDVVWMRGRWGSGGTFVPGPHKSFTPYDCRPSDRAHRKGPPSCGGGFVTNSTPSRAPLPPPGIIAA